MSTGNTEISVIGIYLLCQLHGGQTVPCNEHGIDDEPKNLIPDKLGIVQLGYGYTLSVCGQCQSGTVQRVVVSGDAPENGVPEIKAIAQKQFAMRQ